MKNSKNRIAVIGAGSWGTALAMLLAGKGHQVKLWGHQAEDIAKIAISRENKKYLPGFILSQNIQLTESIAEAVTECDIVCMVVPSHGFRSVFEKVFSYLGEETIIISATKGIENETMMTMSQVITDIKNQHPDSPSCITAVLSGPSFAREVAAGIPTAVTIGCADINKAAELQQVFATEWMRVYASRDVIGLEISAALKNIIAIATGICDGLGYGLNTRAALITRGLAEITRFGLALKAEANTFSGLSGVGDLVLTCTGHLSRNRSVGLALGEGKKLDEILAEMKMVAEGIKTTKSVYQLASRLGIEMPILEQVYRIIYEGKSCDQAVRDLLSRELRQE